MDELTEYKHAHDYWEVEAKRLRAELAEAKLERDTALTDRYDTIQDLRAEIVAKDARITWLKGLLDYATDTDAYRRIRARAEKAEAELAVMTSDRNRLVVISNSVIEERARAEAERDAIRKAIAVIRTRCLGPDYGLKRDIDEIAYNALDALAPSKESKK